MRRRRALERTVGADKIMNDGCITSLQNPRIKQAVKLRRRAAREATGTILIEGYRELKRAHANGVRPRTLFYCPDYFQGENEPSLIADCRAVGAECWACTPGVFMKMAYRDRPEGLLALAPFRPRTLAELVLPSAPLLLVAEQIEKPGNLGTMLRSADAAGVDAVVVCDRCTDCLNPNVVRASIGTLFAVPVAEATTPDLREWLRAHAIHVVAATPHAQHNYTEVDYTQGTAILVGAEQYGLSERWLAGAHHQVRIPMRGQCDSLNVAAAATILLYEAVRQRRDRAG